METSLDDLLILLNKWKTEGNRLSIHLEQLGQTSFDVNRLAGDVVITKASTEEIEFLFGLKTARGSLTIPLSNELISWRVQLPTEPSPLGRISSDFEACIKFTWEFASNDYCYICAFHKYS